MSGAEEARDERMALSPAAARQHFGMVFDMDIRPVLPSIQAPTLVLHSTGDQLVPVEAGRYLADHIDRAHYVELAGDEHFWFLYIDVDQVLEEIAEFITGSRPAAEPQRVLVTLLFTDIVGSTAKAGQLGDRRWRELLDRHDATVRRLLERFHEKTSK